MRKLTLPLLLLLALLTAHVPGFAQNSVPIHIVDLIRLFECMEDINNMPSCAKEPGFKFEFNCTESRCEYTAKEAKRETEREVKAPFYTADGGYTVTGSILRGKTHIFGVRDYLLFVFKTKHLKEYRDVIKMLHRTEEVTESTSDGVTVKSEKYGVQGYSLFIYSIPDHDYAAIVIHGVPD